MKTPILNKDFANKVYDILVETGGAREDERAGFLFHHCENEYGCGEWRFRGVFGFGGKYLSKRNIVTYYSENETPKIKKLAEKINDELSKVNTK